MAGGAVASEFRGDVQGMRALAVLVVVAAHAGVPFLAGGYVGVDVFFVISGYLISSLVYREVDRTGTLSLAGFWSRRARRILPAATLVTSITLVVAVVWMSLIDARDLVLDAVWASLFAANVHFAREGTDYFATDVGPSPLQHYWSLAVEEQFYLVWPLLVVGCVLLARLGRRVLRRGGGAGAGQTDPVRGTPRGLIALLLVLVVAGSFAWSVHQSASAPGSAYFSTFTRAWELGLGALAALLPTLVRRHIGRFVGTVLALVGLGAIGVACVQFTPDTVFPGYAAALPVLGTVALLLAGSGGARPLTNPLLTNRVMRTIGDWSYSMYLWHWPALVLTEHLLVREMRPWERAVAVVAVFLFSGASYRFVERPFREGTVAATFTVRGALVLYPLSLVLVVATSAGTWYWTEWQSDRQSDNPGIAAEPGVDPSEGTEALVKASVDAARKRRAVPSKLSPELLRLRDSIADVGACDYSEDVRILCPRGDVDADRTLVVIGDSHARAWIPAFDKITVEGGWTAYYLVKSQCTASHVTPAPLQEDRPFTECVDFHDWVGEQVEDLEPDLVVVTSSPPVNGVYTEDGRVEAVDKVAPVLADGYDDLFAELSAAAERVVLLRDVPKSAADPGTCLTTGTPDLGACLFSPVERSTVLADVAVASARRSGIEVVDPTPWLCYQGVCPVVIGSTLSYRDTDHLTIEYAASLSEPLGLALEMLPG